MGWDPARVRCAAAMGPAIVGMNSRIRTGEAAPLFAWREHCLCGCLMVSDRSIMVAMRQGISFEETHSSA